MENSCPSLRCFSVLGVELGDGSELLALGFAWEHRRHIVVLIRPGFEACFGAASVLYKSMSCLAHFLQSHRGAKAGIRPYRPLTDKSRNASAGLELAVLGCALHSHRSAYAALMVYLFGDECARWQFRLSVLLLLGNLVFRLFQLN